MTSGHSCRASRPRVPVFMPNALAAIATAESVGVCTTMTGLPRRAGFSCCSHDAKKALRSRNSHCTGLSAVDVFIICSYHNGQESPSPTVPPRYDFRLEDLRVFHLVRANCHACGHKAIVPNARLLQGRLGYTRLMSVER